MQINTVENRNGGITTDKGDVVKTLKEYYEQANTNKFQNPEAMDELIEKYKMQKF